MRRRFPLRIGLSMPQAFLVSIAAVVFALGTGCSASAGSRPTAGGDRGPVRREDPTSHDAGLGRAVRFVRSQRDSVDVPSLLVFDYQARRWNVGGLAGFRRFATTIPDAMTPANAFVRMFGARHHASPAALALLRSTDQLTAVALECERTPVGPAYGRRLRTAVGTGGYDATHVLLALGWIRELGCPFSPAASIRAAAIKRVAAELTAVTAVTDLSLEQACFLGYSGAVRRVPPGWAARIRAAQREDGGWAEDPSAVKVGDHDPARSNWHTTGLALCSLLFATAPGVAATPMVPA